MISYFSRQERLVLSGLVMILVAGSVCSVVFKRYPQLQNIVNVMDTDRLILKTNINTANYEELVDIPYIGPATANSILEYRQAHGVIQDISELKALPVVRLENYKKFSVYIAVNP